MTVRYSINGDTMWVDHQVEALLPYLLMQVLDVMRMG
jgi:hypothetical protein